MIEQQITRPIAQDFMQRRPRRRSVERRVEKLLDPCRIQIFRRAIPRVAQGPDALRGRTRRWRSVVAHGDVPGDRAAFGRSRVLLATSPRPVTRTRRTRNTAARRAVHVIWLQLVHRARSATARPRAASPRQRRRAKERPSTGRSAMTRPRCRCRRHRCLWPARRRPGTERRKKRLPSATMPSRQQRPDVPETIGTPSWTAFLAPNPDDTAKGLAE